MHRQSSSPPSWRGINGLSAELWDIICYHIPNDWLSKVALVSRTFYVLSSPYLYQYVFFVSKNMYCHGRVLGIGTQQEQSWLWNSARSSRILRPDVFFRTICQSRKLKAHIVGCSIQWAREDTATRDVGYAQRILQVLSPSVNMLHLRPSEWPSDFYLYIIQSTAITSLDLPYVRIFYLRERMQGLRENLYKIFRMPTLRHLSLRNVHSWDVFALVGSDNVSKYRYTSNVTSLSLASTAVASGDLKEVLSWPKALQFFQYEVTKGRQLGSILYTPQALTDALYSQRSSLEELSYHHIGGYCKGTTYQHLSQTLRDFTKLKRISLPVEFLFLQQGFNRGRLPIHEGLPPNIEDLIIELPEDFYWGRWGQRDGGAYEHELMQWLQSIADHKRTCFRNLTRIVLWQSDVWLRQYYYEEMQTKKFDGDIMTQGLGILDAFVEAHIDFKLKFTSDCPRFGETSIR